MSGLSTLLFSTRRGKPIRPPLPKTVCVRGTRLSACHCLRFGTTESLPARAGLVAFFDGAVTRRAAGRCCLILRLGGQVLPCLCMGKANRGWGKNGVGGEAPREQGGPAQPCRQSASAAPMKQSVRRASFTSYSDGNPKSLTIPTVSSCTASPDPLTPAITPALIPTNLSSQQFQKMFDTR
jgi:hypothetical protein